MADAVPLATLRPMHSLAQLTPAEADQVILRARRTLAQHAREMRTSPAPGDLRAAIEATLGTLRELAEVHQAKRGKIEALIARYAP